MRTGGSFRGGKTNDNLHLHTNSICDRPYVCLYVVIPAKTDTTHARSRVFSCSHIHTPNVLLYLQMCYRFMYVCIYVNMYICMYVTFDFSLFVKFDQSKFINRDRIIDRGYNNDIVIMKQFYILKK